MRRTTAIAAIVLAGAAAPHAAADGGGPHAVTLPCAPTRVYRTAEPAATGDARTAAAVTAHWPGLAWSPGLARAAALWGRATAGDPEARSSESLLELVLHAAGAPDSTGLATTLGPVGLPTALDELAPVVAAADPPFTHVGLAPIAGGHPGGWAAVLVRRRLELEPVPARVATGGALHLRFTLAAGLDRPELIVARPGRTPRRVLAESRDATWEAQIKLDGTGDVWLIVEATGDRGPEVVATLPVGVGAAPPCTWLPETVAVSTPEVRLYQLVNLDRLRHGLPSLAADPALDEVARDHSRDMAAAGFFAHRSPAHGDLAARLAAHGQAVLAARENIAEAATADEAERSLMSSPGHRANILAPEVTHLGVGAALRPTHGLLFTQVFARPQELRDPAAVRGLIHAGAGDGAADERLDAIAAELARAAASGRRLPVGALDRARAALADAGIGWRSLRLRYLEVTGHGDTEDLGLGGTARVGVGVAGPLEADSSRPWVTVLLILD